MFGVHIDKRSFERAMEIYKSAKAKNASDEDCVRLAIEWYLTSEEQKLGIMS